MVRIKNFLSVIALVMLCGIVVSLIMMYTDTSPRAEIVQVDMVELLREHKIRNIRINPTHIGHHMTHWGGLPTYYSGSINGILVNGVPFKLISTDWASSHKCDSCVYFNLAGMATLSEGYHIKLNRVGLKEAKANGIDKIYLDKKRHSVITDIELAEIDYLSNGGEIYGKVCESSIIGFYFSEASVEDSMHISDGTFDKDSVFIIGCTEDCSLDELITFSEYELMYPNQ